MRRPSRQGLLRYCHYVAALRDSRQEVSTRWLPENLSTAILYFVLLFCLLSATQCIYAQDAGAWTDHYFQQIRSGAADKMVPSSVLDSAVSADVISITPFLRDSNTVVREKACELIYYIAIRAVDSTRQTAVNMLTEISAASDLEIAGMAWRFLKKFSQADFTSRARARLIKTFDGKSPFISEWVKLAGFLQLTELKTRIRSFTLPGHPHALRWAALLALARMGDTSAANEVLSRAKRLPVNDDLVYNILPDLVYTRQRGTFDYLIQLLNDRASNCYSADAEREVAIPCGYRIMELLAPVVYDYPLRVGEWGDIETTDYPASLEQTREWFRTNSNYMILTESY